MMYLFVVMFLHTMMLLMMMGPPNIIPSIGMMFMRQIMRQKSVMSSPPSMVPLFRMMSAYSMMYLFVVMFLHTVMLLMMMGPPNIIPSIGMMFMRQIMRQKSVMSSPPSMVTLFRMIFA